MNEDRSSDHLVLGGLLFLVFSLVVALVFVYTRAADTTSNTIPVTTATIANVAPVVESVIIAESLSGSHIASTTGITLLVGTTKEIVVHGIVSDANGSQVDGSNPNGDISNVTMTLYRSGVTGAEACTADNNDCYKVPSCTASSTYQGGDGATQAEYSCTVSVQFYADSTTAGGAYPAQTWKAYVAVTDLSTASASLTNETDVNALLALNLPTSIPYGSFALGATTTSSNNQVTSIEQRGNVIADVEVSATVMTCDALGLIPIANQKWSLFDVGYSDTASSTALTASTTPTDTNIAIGYRGAGTDAGSADGTTVSKNLFWNIAIPATGVRGICTGSNTITIKAN